MPQTSDERPTGRRSLCPLFQAELVWGKGPLRSERTIEQRSVAVITKEEHEALIERYDALVVGFEDLFNRCDRAKAETAAMASSLEIISGQFAALTSANVGLRVGKVEDKVAEIGARQGSNESPDDRQDARIEEIATKGGALSHRLGKLEMEASPTP